jgi:predicted nucleic acid-binding protein
MTKIKLWKNKHLFFCAYKSFFARRLILQNSYIIVVGAVKRLQKFGRRKTVRTRLIQKSRISTETHKVVKLLETALDMYPGEGTEIAIALGLQALLDYAKLSHQEISTLPEHILDRIERLAESNSGAIHASSKKAFENLIPGYDSR